MYRIHSRFLLCGWLGILFSGAMILGQSIPNYTVQVTASPRRTGPWSGEVRLHWVSDSLGALVPTYQVFRRSSSDWRRLQDQVWTELGPGGTNGFFDPVVPVGRWLEYRVEKNFTGFRIPDFEEDLWASGFVLTGVDLPEVSRRGRALILVDRLTASELRSWTTETNRMDLFQRFLEDLAGDGWEVEWDAGMEPEGTGGFPARLEQVRLVKQRIRAFYGRNPKTAEAVILLGDIPVPRSGYSWFPYHAELPEEFPDYELNGPDRHGNYAASVDGVVTREDGSPVIGRYWPADAYYGDLSDPADSGWTDSSIRWMQRDWPLVDGVFDQSFVPASNRVQLVVGRIDFRDMPVMGRADEPANEIRLRLLANYLEKNHAWRHGTMHPMGRLAMLPAARRGVVVNNFSDLGGEAPAALPLGGFTPLFGSDRTEMIYNLEPGFNESLPPHLRSPWYLEYGPNWFRWLEKNPVLCAYGCGAGSPTAAAGVAKSEDYRVESPPVAFNFFFGSYFSEWTTRNNLMRASIAAANSGLGAIHAARPKLVLHPLALGHPIGEVFRLTINNDGENAYRFWFGSVSRGTHLALMGDPTLRLHVVEPLQQVRGRTIQGIRELTWEDRSSIPGFAGYEVWNGPTSTGPFSRVSRQWSNEYRLHRGQAYPWYLVKLRKTESTPSGTYVNTSQGQRFFLPVDPNRPSR